MEGKVALVTGGSSGMGRATALAFARKGAKTVVADVSVEGGQETVHLIQEAGGNAIFVKADVSNMNEVEELVSSAAKTYSRLDYAFNNAGIVRAATITDCTEDEWSRIMDINLKGVWLCMKYEILAMQGGGGVIINNASTEGIHSQPRRPIYSASKHGVIGLTKAAAIAYAGVGIRVNAVCPGPIRTAQTEPVWRRDAQGEAKAISRVPLRRIGAPEEVAEAVVWLCSDAASYITGHALVVDGGSTAGQY